MRAAGEASGEAAGGHRAPTRDRSTARPRSAPAPPRSAPGRRRRPGPRQGPRSGGPADRANRARWGRATRPRQDPGRVRRQGCGSAREGSASALRSFRRRSIPATAGRARGWGSGSGPRSGWGPAARSAPPETHGGRRRRYPGWPRLPSAPRSRWRMRRQRPASRGGRAGSARARWGAPAGPGPRSRGLRAAAPTRCRSRSTPRRAARCRSLRPLAPEARGAP